jgi:Uncharacterized protein conserved in bacteria
MEIQQLFANKTLWTAVLAWFLAQLFKVILTLLAEKRMDISRMYGSGGMPSSHSALVTAMTTCIGKIYGFDSPIFGVSCVFSIIVMYDAAGVRRAAGKQARAINLLFMHAELKFEEQLKELLGHTPLQVFCGAVLGIVVGYLF